MSVRSTILPLLSAAALSLAAVAALAQDNVLVDTNGKNNGSLDYGLRIGGPQPHLGLTGRTNCTPAVPPETRPHCVPEVGRVSGPSQTGIASKRSDGGNQFGLDLYTANTARLSITNAGLIGIGTLQPTRTLELRRAGDVEIGMASNDAGGRFWSIQSSGTVDPTQVGNFQIVDRTLNVKRLGIDAQGTVSVGVLQITGGSDVAEPFLIGSALPPGSVVSIDPNVAGHLRLTDRAYDRRVAGVVSSANGVSPGLTLRQIGDGEGGQDVALSGRVYVLADARTGAIAPGDMLTTSKLPGHAMKAGDLKRAQGAIIGKAMSALQRGTGMVLVLVGLQ